MKQIPTTSAQIRESYLNFFAERGSKRMASSSLVPDDPSMLLTSAGMVQFKPYFLGHADLDAIGAATCQKCVRTTDIDVIGLDGRHQSFFEMLGNFSFGGYSKEQACAWAFEYITEHLQLPMDRLYFSIFETDDEAHDIWVKLGVPEERIVRLGEEDNFWAAGPTGPCGPCSEIYYDQGEGLPCADPEHCAPGCDCDRYLEFWNLVFTQYDRQEDGALKELPRKNIDTGMGLERMAGIMQGVQSNYDTDVLRSIVSVAERLSNKRYGEDEATDVSMRILADHSRAVTFMVGDGVLPSNEGRGYVLRRLLRRAARHGKLLGIPAVFLSTFVDHIVDIMGEAYPEIVENHTLINGIVRAEEERFASTIAHGEAYLEQALAQMKEGDVLDGEVAFTLRDTYGFPIDLTQEMAGEHGCSVDLDQFEVHMTQQRERARAQVKNEVWTSYESDWTALAQQFGETAFDGEVAELSGVRVLAVLQEGKVVSELRAGDTGEVLLDSTCFYGERGGQVGDRGSMCADGLCVHVLDTQMAEKTLVAHKVQIEEGVLAAGDEVNLCIDAMRRERIRRNHTATHLLHWALRSVLGDHVHQAGSLVQEDRLRFDITHFEPVTAHQLEQVEQMVNEKIMQNVEARAYQTTLNQAKEAGVIALFGEKYGDEVRVLELGDFSAELCGGTHVRFTSEIGLFKIVSESSVGANVRRIEAVTSFDALEYYQQQYRRLCDIAAQLKVPLADAGAKVASMTKRNQELIKQVKQLKMAGAGGVNPVDLARSAVDVGFPLVVTKLENYDASAIRELWDQVKNALPNGALIAFSVNEGGAVTLIAAGSDGAVAQGFHAGNAVKALAPLIGGGGGGRDRMAQAGGKNAAGVDEALTQARALYAQA